LTKCKTDSEAKLSRPILPVLLGILGSTSTIFWHLVLLGYPYKVNGNFTYKLIVFCPIKLLIISIINFQTLPPTPLNFRNIC
jgi:hypothetical protein